MFAKIEINFHALGQPEYGVFLLKWDCAVFNNLMLGKKLYLRQRSDQFRFNPHDLEIVRGNPCASFYPNGVNVAADLVCMKVIGPVVALLEANQPGCLTMPIAQAFTFHLEGVAHARMKD